MNTTGYPPPTEQAFRSITRHSERTDRFGGIFYQISRHANALARHDGFSYNNRDEGRGARDEYKTSRPSTLASRPSQGFSLVELSIVLVILGLLTGGILTGQNLIRAAELRSVMTEFTSYQTAIHTFRDKYFALPGDMTNATRFWGSAGGSGTLGDGCEAAIGTGTQTCNGDGNGRLDWPAAASEYGETFTLWQHLANAGLIEGSYTGVAGPNHRSDVEAKVNVPISKLGGNVVHSARGAFSGSVSGDAYLFDGNYGNFFGLGGDVTGNWDGDDPIISAEEMWNIDSKMDDGRPATGNLRSYKGSVRVNCVSADDQTAEYLLNNTITNACNIIFITGF